MTNAIHTTPFKSEKMSAQILHFALRKWLANPLNLRSFCAEKLKICAETRLSGCFAYKKSCAENVSCFRSYFYKKFCAESAQSLRRNLRNSLNSLQSRLECLRRNRTESAQNHTNRHPAVSIGYIYNPLGVIIIPTLNMQNAAQRRIKEND